MPSLIPSPPSPTTVQKREEGGGTLCTTHRREARPPTSKGGLKGVGGAWISGPSVEGEKFNYILLEKLLMMVYKEGGFTEGRGKGWIKRGSVGRLYLGSDRLLNRINLFIL